MGSLIVRVRRALLERLGEEFGTDTALPEVQVLWHLNDKGPLTQRALADWTGQHPAGLSRMLDALEKDGVVRRARCATDRRCVLVSLSRTGARSAKRMTAAHHNASVSLLAPLTDGERSTLRALLVKVVGQPARPPR